MRINKWYDDLQEPKRFLFFIVCVGMPVLLLMHFYPPAGIILGGIFIAIRMLG